MGNCVPCVREQEIDKRSARQSYFDAKRSEKNAMAYTESQLTRKTKGRETSRLLHLHRKKSGDWLTARAAGIHQAVATQYIVPRQYRRDGSDDAVLLGWFNIHKAGLLGWFNVHKAGLLGWFNIFKAGLLGWFNTGLIFHVQVANEERPLENRQL
jgi:hypothetical protein